MFILGFYIHFQKKTVLHVSHTQIKGIETKLGRENVILKVIFCFSSFLLHTVLGSWAFFCTGVNVAEFSGLKKHFFLS